MSKTSTVNTGREHECLFTLPMFMAHYITLHYIKNILSALS